MSGGSGPVAIGARGGEHRLCNVCFLRVAAAGATCSESPEAALLNVRSDLAQHGANMQERGLLTDASAAVHSQHRVKAATRVNGA